jgi:glucosyl-3-phosphoglycerate synthase
VIVPQPDLAAWAARRCSHATDWPVPALLEAKVVNGARVAVVLPALNEATTVAAIVSSIATLTAPDGEHALVDELVVVDSGSTDDTARLAAEAGARVVSVTEVLPDVPPVAGKGEALWRGVAATSADVVVFVDSDLEEFDLAFVTGLLGPLLTDPGVLLVKATYDRPLHQGETVLPAGGGRVTELVARPLLNMFWPALAGFVQPLSGEYAARRSFLEGAPFPVGYGVELGLLVDAYAAAGLDCLAQVDLQRRKHRHNTDAKLGVMASEILHVALRRLAAAGRLQVAEPPATALLQFVRDGADHRGTLIDVPTLERPPLRSLPAVLHGAPPAARPAAPRRGPLSGPAA